MRVGSATRVLGQDRFDMQAPNLIEGREFDFISSTGTATVADAGIAICESKYYYEFWRPVTGIRESDIGGATHEFRGPLIAGASGEFKKQHVCGESTL